MAKRGRMFAVFFSLLVCVASLVAAVACGGKGGDVKYTVTYAAGADDATGSVPVESYVAGAPVILRDVDTFVRDGYEFTQWSDGSELYDAGDTYVMPAKNVTFTAQWEKTETQSLPDGSEQVDSVPVGALVTENGTAKANWFARYGENGIEITAWVADAAVYTVSDNVYASDGIEIVFAVLSNKTGYTDRTVSVCVAANGLAAVKNLKENADATIDGLVTEAKYLTLDSVTLAGYRVGVTMPYDAVGVSKDAKNAVLALGLTNATGAGNAQNVYHTEFGTDPANVNTYIELTADNTFAENRFLNGGATWGNAGSLIAADSWILDNDDGTENATIEMTGISGDNFVYMRGSALTHYYAEVQLTVKQVCERVGGGYDGYPKFGMTVFSADGARGLFYYVDSVDGENPDGVINADSTAVGYVLRAAGAWGSNWTNTGNLGAGATSEAYQNGNYVTLGIYRQGENFRLLVNGNSVAVLRNIGIGADETAYVGLASFNLLLKAQSYSITMEQDVLARYAIEEEKSPLKTLDGSLADWTDAEKTNPFVIPSTEGRRVTVYACKDANGVNIFYDVYHAVHKTTENEWWMNTNVEFRLGGDEGKQYAVAANGYTANVKYYYMGTTQENGLYHTVAEIFVPYSELEGYTAQSATVPAQFFFKIGGVYGNPWATGDWWRTDEGTSAQGVLIAGNGIVGGTVKTVDGSDADWAGAKWTTTNRSQWAASLEEDGLYLIVKLTQQSISADRAFVSGADGTEACWWLNQNVEIQQTANLRRAMVIFMNGEAYHTGYVNDAAVSYTDGADFDTLIFEIFIARENITGIDENSESIELTFGGQLFSDATSTGNVWEQYASRATVRVPSYTVTYSDGDASSTGNVRMGAAIGSLPVPAGVAGYTFDGWYVDGVKIDESYVPTGDVTVVAKYNPVLPGITFDANGGDLKADASAPAVTPVWNEGEKCYTVVLPAECPYELADYEFEKWAVAAEGITGSTQYDPGATVVLAPGSKITVSVVWIAAGAKTYQVTFSLGYEGAPEYGETRTVEEGSTLADLPVDPERSGYRFLGWYDESDRAFTADRTVNADTALTAKWVRLVTVTYDLGYEGAGTAPAAATVDEGECVALPETPVREYYLFLGWYYGESNELTAETAVTDHLTVTAKWAVDRDSQENIDYLFIGDSIISTSFWYTYAGQFGGLNSVNLGVPGTQIPYWIDKLSTADILQYNPVNVVMHIGINDVNDGAASDETVIGRLTTLFAGLKEIYPEVNLYYISICHNALFPQNRAIYESVNAWVGERTNVTFIDVAQYITTDESGVAETQWFISDGLHLNENGYGLWNRALANEFGLPYTVTGGGLGETTVEGAPSYGYTGGWTYDADTQIWHFGETGPGISKLTISEAYGSTLYAEAKISIAGMYNGDQFGKAGIAVSSATATYFFYVNLSYGANSDGIYDDNYGSLAYCPEIRGAKNWVYPESDGGVFRPFGGNGYVHLGAEAYDYNVDPTAYKTLGVAKYGKSLYFFSSGSLVGKLENSLFGENEAVSVSVYNFNANMYAKAGSATTVAEEVDAILTPYVSLKTLDGSLADWTDAEKTNPVVIPSSNGRSVTVYASLDDRGVNIFYDIYHSAYAQDAANWFDNTNVEFRLGAESTKQYFMNVKGERGGFPAGYMATTNDPSGLYHTVAELYVPYSAIEGNYSKDSAFIPSMFAYKTPGEGNPIWSQNDFWFSSNFEERVHLITRDGFLAAGEKTIDGNADDWAGATFTTGGRAEYATYLGEDGFYLYIRQTLDSIGGNRAFYGLDWWLNQNLEIQATENFGSGHVAFFNGKAYVFRGVTQAAATYTDGETSDTIVYELFISKYIMKGDTSETVIFSCGGQTFADNKTTVNAWQVYASGVTVRVPSYTVTYSDGDASSTAYVRMGAAIGSLPAPAGVAGYTFDGWYVDGVKIDESYVPTGDVTVVAKYNPVLPGITFDANGGDLKADASAPAVTPVWNEGEKCYTVVLPAECPYELADYEFEKWAVAAEGISGSTQYDPGATVVLAPGSKITVSVVWIAAGAKTYRVTFSLGYEGAPEYDETRTVEEGSTVTDFPVDPERGGYRFLGWYDESDRAFTEDTAVSANTALTAKWVRLVTVTYDLGYEGAGTAPAAATVDEGTCVTLPEPPVRAYYLFLGWFYGENNEFTAETAVTENLTVTAKWAVDRDSQENINYLFIGASTISTSYWYTYGGQFGSSNQAVNLAVPGTRVEYWIEKLSTADILQYNPANIVMHIGMNNVNDGMESDETVIGRLTTLFAGLKEIYPDANLYYVSIIPNVAFSQNTATYQSVNNWAKAQEGISFIDVAQYITTGKNGVPEMQWYASDGLHPGVDGYTIFHREIAVALGLPYTEAGAGLGDTNVEGAPDYGHTAGWTYDADTQIWHNNDVGVMGVHKLMIDGAYGATLYAEAKVSVAGMYCGETVGKGGLAVSSPTATYFFFINLSYGANSDGIYDDNYGSLAYRPEIRGGKDWVYPEDASFRPFGGNGYVPLGAEAYDHNVDPTAYKTLGIAKVGSALYFYASGNLVGALNNSLFGKDEAVTVSVFNFNTDMYAKAGFATTAAEKIGAKVPSHEKTIDGSLADWSESDKTNPVVYPATNGRSVTVYATMGGDGVYIFYDVLHTEHVTTHAVTEWHLNTNVEFRLGSKGTQFFFTTNGFRNGIAIGDAVMITTQEGSMYHTVAEIFVPYTHADLAAYPADGEYVPAGFAFKVEGQDGALWASGNWWYVPEADPNNPNFIVTKNGIKTGSEKSIDGDLSDWADVSFTTSAGTKEGVTAQYAAYLGADGLYVAITVREASIDVGRTNTAGNWWTNTNIEMFATDNTYAARLVTFGGKLYYTGRISAAAQSFTDGDSEDVWTVEFFIANENLKNVTAETASIVVDFGGQLYGAVTNTWQDYARGITATRG